MRQRASGGSVILPSSRDVIASSVVSGQKSNRSGLVTRRSKYFLCLLQSDVSVLFPLMSLFVHCDVFYHLSSCLWYIEFYFVTEMFRICQTTVAESVPWDGRQSMAVQPARLLCSIGQIESYIESRFVEQQQSDLV